MACASVAPIFKFTYFEPVNSWPAPTPPAKKVLGDATGENDPYKKIIGFTANLGMGDQSSSIVIDISGFHCDAEANVGRLAIFECNTFKFGGMIKSVVHSEDGSGQKTKITMSDMKDALARYDLFINEWHDTTDEVNVTTRNGNTWKSTYYTGWNCKNIHRVIEGDSWGAAIRTNKLVFSQVPIGDDPGVWLPDVANCNVFGTHTDGKVSQGTTTYYKILQALVDEPARWYNTHSYPLWIFLGSLRNVARDEIPYVGTNAKTMTLLELINNVCEEAGYDWTFHTPSADNQRVLIELIDKKTQPAFGSVKNWIRSARNNKTLLDYKIGAEFKNEKTRRVVIGSRVNYIKELYMPYGGYPGGIEKGGGIHENAYVLGFDSDNMPILSYASNFNGPGSSSSLGNTPTMNIASLNASLNAVGLSFQDTFNISEGELLSTGTLATWKLYGILNTNSLCYALMSLLGIPANAGYNKIAFGSNMHTLVQSCIEAVKFSTKKTAGELYLEEICYPWIKNYYDTFYGKWYMAFIPKRTCGFSITGNTDVWAGQGGSFLSDEPTDSAWPDRSLNNTIGLLDRSIFEDSSGKLTCFCGINVNDSLNRAMRVGGGFQDFYFDASGMQQEYKLGNGGTHIYTKAEVDGRAYWYSPNKLGVLIKMPSMITQRFWDYSGLANNMGLRMLEMLIGNISGYSQFGGTTDFSYANVFKETFAAGRYDRIAIPMKSNIMNYGPWLSHTRRSYWSDGGVEMKHVEDLNPWNYGGYDAMHQAGNKLAQDGIKNRLKYESGSVTIAGSPDGNLGEGDSSIVSSIVCRLDSKGAVTTYNLETFVPKFGQSAEAFNNYTKLNVSARRYNLNILKEINREILRAFADGGRAFGRVRETLFQDASVPLSASSSSLNNVLILSYPDGGWPGRIEAGIDKKFTSDYFQDQDNYSKYAIVSLDMIFSPVAIAGSNDMPSLTGGAGSTIYLRNAPRPKKPPTTTTIPYVLTIGSFQLNPYTSTAMMGNFGSAGSGPGFITEYIAFGSIPGNTFLGGTDNQTNFRVAALRGPLLLHSWGYDLDGNPVPGSPGTFNGGWMSNPTSWPCGPIDLRWDSDRGVWVSPPSSALVVATLSDDLEAYGSVSATVTKIFSNAGAGGTITVSDFVGNEHPEGTVVIAYHYGPSTNYAIIHAGPLDKQYIFADNKGCDDEEAPTGKTGPLDGHIIGYDKGKKLALYSLKKLFDQPNVECKPNSVLACESKNGWGHVCMQEIPIVDCSGNPPGGGSSDPL